MNGWKAIIFDLDDTLYPERDYVQSGFRAVAAWAEMHLGIGTDDGFKQLEGLFDRGFRRDTFDRWLAMHGIWSKSHVVRLVEVYRGHAPDINPFPEVNVVLEGLKAAYRLGLVSDGYLAMQQRKLTALNLAHYFDAIVFSDELGREAWKPDPRPFELVLKRLGLVDGAPGVFVGDNPSKDFLGARNTGLTTLRVRRPNGIYARHEPPTPHHCPNAELASLSELPTALERLSELRKQEFLLEKNIRML